jgi:hybrid cluster-associated redox disulfide protein
MQSADIATLSLAEIMSRWPPTIRIFLDRRMHCVGCPIAPFHTVVDAAEEHGLSYDVLLGELEARAGRDEGRPPP